MANGWNLDSDREATLRRVAIVLSSLPAPVASQLLGSIGSETKNAVRRTMTSLADVDPLERRRAIQAFKISVQQQPSGTNRSSPAAANPDRFEGDTSSPVSRPTSRVVSSSMAQGPASVQVPGASNDVFESTRSHDGASAGTDPTPSSPLSFLSQVDDEILVRLLAFEHPQAVALVLASIAPAQAARVLPRLDPSIQSDALSRIGRLGEIPETAAAEIAEHFKNRLAQQPSNGTKATGRRALDAILAELPASTSRTTDPTPQARTPLTNPHAVQQSAEAASTSPVEQIVEQIDEGPMPVRPVSFPTADIPAIDLSHKLRVAQHTWPRADDENPSSSTIDEVTQDQGQARREEWGSGQADPPTQATVEGAQPQQVSAAQQASGGSLDSTDAIHEHLLSLTPAELCQALGQVDTRDAMLTLCGLPNAVTESALAILPRAVAKKVRVKMSTLGSLHLREIDEAKEKVAQVSLASSNQLPLAA